MVQWVIAEVMADHELEPDNIANEYRRHSVYGWGAFRCEECRVSWTSQITWATIDIKEQCIKRRFKQKCRSCEKPQRPWWHIQEFAYMVEFALNRYRKLVAGKWRPSARASRSTPVNPPHKSEFCERCGFGKSQCWIASQAGKQQPSKDMQDLEEKELDLKTDKWDEEKMIATSEESVKPRRISETKTRPRRRPKSTSITENESDAQTKSENELDIKVQSIKKSDKGKQGNESDSKQKSESESDIKINAVPKPIVKARPRRRSDRTSRPKSESDEKLTPTRSQTESNAEKGSGSASMRKSQSGENEAEKSNNQLDSAIHKTQVNRLQNKSDTGEKITRKNESSQKTPRRNESSQKTPRKTQDESSQKTPRRNESSQKTPRKTEDESGQKTPRRNESSQKTPRKTDDGEKSASKPDASGKKSQKGEPREKLSRKSESSEKGSPQNKADVKQRKSESDEIQKSEIDEAAQPEKENAGRIKASGNFELKAKPQRPGRFTRRSGNTPKKIKTHMNGKNSGGEEGSAANNAELPSKETAGDNLGRTSPITASSETFVKSAVNSEEADSSFVLKKLENGEPNCGEDDASSVVEIKSLFENDASSKVEASVVKSTSFDNGKASLKEDSSSIVEIGFLFESTKANDDVSTSTTENSSVLEITTFEQLSEIQVE